MGKTVQTPDFNFPVPCCDTTPRRESTILGSGIRRTALKLGRANCNGCRRSVAHPFLRRAPARVSMWKGLGGGVHTLCPLHRLPHQRAPRVCALLQRVRAAREG